MECESFNIGFVVSVSAFIICTVIVIVWANATVMTRVTANGVAPTSNKQRPTTICNWRK